MARRLSAAQQRYLESLEDGEFTPHDGRTAAAVARLGLVALGDNGLPRLTEAGHDAVRFDGRLTPPAPQP